MEEKLDQIEKNETWELVPRPKDKNVIGTKWVFRNQLSQDGQVTRNKAKLVYVTPHFSPQGGGECNAPVLTP